MTDRLTLEPISLAVDSFVVICLDRDPGDDVTAATYHLATRQVFATRGEANVFAAAVHPVRFPMVIAGRWGQLRLPR